MNNNGQLNNIEAQEAHSSIDFRSLVDKILDRWAFILISLVIALVIAFLMNRYTTPVYVINSSLMIKAPKEITNSVSGLLYGEEFFGRNTTNLDNEAVLLKSINVVEKTLRDLKLDVEYYNQGDIRDAELYLKSPITFVVTEHGSRLPYNRIMILNRVSDSTFTIGFEEPSVMDKLAAMIPGTEKPPKNIFEGRVFTFGQNEEVGNFKFKVKLNKKKFQGPVLVKVIRFKRLVKKYRSKITVSPYSEESSVLKVSMEGQTPDKVIDFVNALVENYIVSELEQKNNIATKTIEFINKQIAYMGDSLNVAEDKLETFKSSTNPVTLDDQGTSLVSALNQYLRDRSSLTLQVSHMKDLQRLVINNHLDQIIMPSTLGIEDNSLNSSVGELMDLVLEIKVVEANKKLNNPLVRLKYQQIEGLKNNIQENIKSLIAASEFRIRDLDGKIGGLRSSMVNLPKAEREYTNITRNYELNESLWLFLMEKKAEAGIAKASNTVDFRIVDAAQVQGTAPVKPSPILNYAFAIILGLVVPIVLIFVHDLLNNKISSKEDLKGLTKLPLLGIIAKSKGKKNFMVLEERPKSAVSESFRNIRSNLRYMSKDQNESQVFLLTSTVSGEGKTFCSQNLAYVFSNFGKKVLIIHSDMRKYADFSEYGIETNFGLSDYLANLASFDDVVSKSRFNNLFVITPGGIPPNPSELLIAGRFNKLVDTAKASFDYIIIDTPPVGIISDAQEVMLNADVNIYVVRKDFTLKKHLDEINSLHLTQKVKNICLLLNSVDYKKSKYGYGYYEEPDESWWKKAVSKKAKIPT